MKIKVSTQVASSWKKVLAGFNESLFKSLNPPFPPVKVMRFDGCKTNHRVELELNFFLFKQYWHALIISHLELDKGFVFVDIGKKLPFFLKSWKHTHSILEEGNGTQIIDDIEYSTGTLLSDLIFYPILYLQFLYRKPVYKREFR
jgi:ligand-binding SRPBCC domain-containing protein